MQGKTKLSVTILAYPGMTMLDAVGPNEVLANSPNFDVTWVATQASPITNDLSSFDLHSMPIYDSVKTTDILLIPGGPGDKAVMENQAILDWIKELDRSTLLTTSVCTGSLILAKAQILNGHRACTHWACLKQLAELGVKPQRKRFVQSGKYVTASGVSAGIDMAFYLLEKLVSKNHARDIRFGVEYFPNQFHLFSSYTLPKSQMAKLSRKFGQYYQAAQAKFLS